MVVSVIDVSRRTWALESSHSEPKKKPSPVLLPITEPTERNSPLARTPAQSISHWCWRTSSTSGLPHLCPGSAETSKPPLTTFVDLFFPDPPLLSSCYGTKYPNCSHQKLSISSTLLLMQMNCHLSMDLVILCLWCVTLFSTKKGREQNNCKCGIMSFQSHPHLQCSLPMKRTHE